MSGRPLDGIIVLDLTRILAGPFATMKLADMGACVWKLERPGSGDDTRGWGPPFEDGWSCYFTAVNRGKQSIALDLKKDDGKRVLERLITKADVLMENFRPGTLEKLGFSWDRLRELNPQLIYCSVSGYGHHGEVGPRASYDVIVQGESGVQDLTGPGDGLPYKSGISMADLMAGMLAVEGVLLALLNRQRTGQGDRVDIALLDGLLHLLTYQSQGWLGAGVKPRRIGNQHPSIVPYQAFETSDGFINIGVGSEALWQRFCDCIERPDLLTESRFAANTDRVQNRSELQELLTPILAARSTDDWCRILGAAGIPCGKIRDVPTALDLAAEDTRGMVVDIPGTNEAGEANHTFRCVGNPVRLESMAESEGFAYAPPPRLGEHSNAILAECGYDTTATEALHAAAVVA